MRKPDILVLLARSGQIYLGRISHCGCCLLAGQVAQCDGNSDFEKERGKNTCSSVRKKIFHPPVRLSQESLEIPLSFWILWWSMDAIVTPSLLSLFPLEAMSAVLWQCSFHFHRVYLSLPLMPLGPLLTCKVAFGDLSMTYRGEAACPPHSIGKSLPEKRKLGEMRLQFILTGALCIECTARVFAKHFLSLSRSLNPSVANAKRKDFFLDHNISSSFQLRKNGNSKLLLSLSLNNNISKP